MTRTYTEQPVWTWKCDECGREQELARQQSGSGGLPLPNEMRARGWFIAETFGDKCPLCVSKSSTALQLLAAHRRKSHGSES